MHGDLKPGNVLCFVDQHANMHVKLCDFDSSRVVGVAGPAGAFSHRGAALKYSRGWESPEVRGGTGGTLRASFAIDLFALGLMVEILHRPLCDPSSCVLPSDETASPHPLDDPSGLSLRAMLQCLGRSHEQVVLGLCAFNPEKRMSARDALKALDKSKTDFIQQRDELKAAVADRLDAIHEDSGAVKQSVERLSGKLGDTQREAKAAGQMAEEALYRAQDAHAGVVGVEEMVLNSMMAAAAARKEH
jgi:serine/threonine protein kinase